MGNDFANKIENGFVGSMKGIASTIPGVSIVMSAVNEMQTGIYRQRLEEWQRLVEERLSKLENTVVNNLPQNGTFATVMLISAQLSLKTDNIKTALLANAVANSATTNISEERIVILLNCIERYTLSHLRLLRFLQNPKEYNPREDMLMGSPMTKYNDYYPNRDKSLDNIVIKDLYADGLIDTDSLNTTMTLNGCLSKRTTDLGDNMISFFGIEKIETYVRSQQ